MYRHLVAAVGAIVIATLPLNILAQGRPDSPALMAAQSEAMKRLAFMDGTWRGTAQSVLPTGEKHTITQTERVGPFLGGTVKVIEGRGYEADGSVGFNAFAVVSFNPATRVYNMSQVLRDEPRAWATPRGRLRGPSRRNEESGRRSGITFLVLGLIRPSGAFTGLGAAFLAIGMARKRRHSN